MVNDSKQPSTPVHVCPVSASTLMPEQVLQLYSEDDWEQFILEWAEGFDPPYAHIERLGGPGDKGRDVVGYTGELNTDCEMDVYQCKHRPHPLFPGDIWTELGKLCVYTWRGDYRVPRRYQFVAPQGVGTSVHDLLQSPVKLRTQLIAEWDAQCRDKISKKQPFPLEGGLLQHVQIFNFSVVGYIPTSEVLEQHSRTRHWHHRFRRDYPPRPPAQQPPAEVAQNELRYVRQLLDAYADYLDVDLPDVPALQVHPNLANHFVRCRTDFYMAESLNRFYRDQFTEGAFEHVKKQVYDGVVDIATAPYADGYRRVVATVSQAAQVQLAQSEHTYCVEPGDKKGLCHHLANEDTLTWVDK